MGFVIALVLGLAGVAGADAHARLTIVEARKIALAKVPGTIVHEKLKTKKKHAIYSIKIKPRDAKGSVMLEKVEIDGDTGAVLKVKNIKPKSTDKED